MTRKIECYKKEETCTYELHMNIRVQGCTIQITQSRIRMMERLSAIDPPEDRSCT